MEEERLKEEARLREIARKQEEEKRLAEAIELEKEGKKEEAGNVPGENKWCGELGTPPVCWGVQPKIRAHSMSIALHAHKSSLRRQW